MMNIYGVGQVAGYLRESLEADDFLADLWVQGEMSNVSRSGAGHLYFTLKDPSGQLRCVMFRSAVAGQSDLTFDQGGAIEGAAVVVHGRMSFYEARGDLQVICDVVMPQGTGVLYMEYQRLKAKLETEGLFDISRKRELPEFPRRIAVITSPTGAVLHDIVTIIERRYPLVELMLVPVTVQGDRAADSVVEAFAMLNQISDIDAIIVARGGGSIEELWPFNEERTARAIYASRVPVISAVGHETDFTIADYVADVRAPTPSAAAELAVPNQRELYDRLSGWDARLRGLLKSNFLTQQSEVEMLLRRLMHRQPNAAQQRQRVDDLSRMAAVHLRNTFFTHRSAIEQRQAVLASLDPKRTLQRGYAIVQTNETGQVVQQRLQVHSGDGLTIQVRDGSFAATVGAPPPPPRPRRPYKAPDEQLALDSLM